MNSITNFFKKTWVKNGLFWGLWMFISLLIANYFTGIFFEKFTLSNTLMFLAWWMVSGLIFGYVSGKFQKKENKLKNNVFTKPLSFGEGLG